jgi:hypothetical protein
VCPAVKKGAKNEQEQQKDKEKRSDEEAQSAKIILK